MNPKTNLSSGNKISALIAEDDPIMLKMLESLLLKWGYTVKTVTNGDSAWNILQSNNHPPLVVLDWMMPGKDGVELCREFRKMEGEDKTYIILLTSKGRKEDILEGFDAGVNDYITKPFDRDEFKSRIMVGTKMIRLHTDLEARVRELQEAIDRIKTLEGIVSICSYCKKIRNDKDYWEQLESYMSKYTNVRFSHGICPECYDKYVQPELDNLKI